LVRKRASRAHPTGADQRGRRQQHSAKGFADRRVQPDQQEEREHNRSLKTN